MFTVIHVAKKKGSSGGLVCRICGSDRGACPSLDYAALNNPSEGFCGCLDYAISWRNWRKTNLRLPVELRDALREILGHWNRSEPCPPELRARAMDLGALVPAEVRGTPIPVVVGLVRRGKGGMA